MKDSTRLSVAALALVACVVITGLPGCGDSGPKLYSVSGTLTHNGNPLADIVVTFLPTDGSRSSAGTTDASGRFTLYFTADEEGVQGGEHVVCIRSNNPEPGAIDKSLQALVAKYGDETKSPCKVTIESDEDNLEVKLD